MRNSNKQSIELGKWGTTKEEEKLEKGERENKIVEATINSTFINSQ